MFIFLFISLSFADNNSELENLITNHYYYSECIDCPDGYYAYFKNDIFTCLNCGCDNCQKTDYINKETNEIISYAGRCSSKSSCYEGFGFDSKTEVCTICQPGYYSVRQSLSTCNKCERNTITSNEGSSKCIQCPKYQVSNEERTSCHPCEPGQYFDETQQTCFQCPKIQ